MCYVRHYVRAVTLTSYVVFPPDPILTSRFPSSLLCSRFPYSFPHAHAFNLTTGAAIAFLFPPRSLPSSAALQLQSQHPSTMAASLLELPAKFLGPFWAWVDATPIYVLMVLFVALILFALLAVSSTPNARRLELVPDSPNRF